jgi:hypothetical protein
MSIDRFATPEGPSSLAQALGRLLAPGAVPPWFQADICRTREEMDRLNEELLASGFFDVPWPQPFFAIGRDPAGNVYFIDTREAALPVCLANHELLSSDSLADLDCAEAWGDSVDRFLAELRARDAESERETPHAVFAAGHVELERLRAQPNADSLRAFFAARATPFCALAESRRRELTFGPFHWQFSGFAPSACFALVDDAVSLALEQDDPCLFGAALDLLASLGEATKTTELPPLLDEKWLDLAALVERYDARESRAWEQLTTHYRLHSR